MPEYKIKGREIIEVQFEVQADSPKDAVFLLRGWYNSDTGSAAVRVPLGTEGPLIFEVTEVLDPAGGDADVAFDRGIPQRWECA